MSKLSRAAFNLGVSFLLVVISDRLHNAHAQPATARYLSYPAAPAADSCGGAPGDPPVFTFAPGKAQPITGDPTLEGRLKRWRTIIRPDIELVLLTGTADQTEAGYTQDLALRRAEAVRDLLAALHIDPARMWIRGQSVRPATPIEHEPIFARSVTIADPLRVLGCDRALQAARFRWFLAHCASQKTDATTQSTCDIATAQLSGRRKEP